MPAHRTITVDARRYADADDCLTAAADAYVAAHPEVAGYDLAPRWGDDDRETIALDIPARVLVETMPEWLIESHRAARNFGSYPHNGAERRIVDAADVDDVIADNGYDRIVRVASDADVARYGDRD